MVLIAAGLIILGGFIALLGQKLFRALLPIAGLVVGIMVGFGGVQSVFGSGAISLTIAVIMALIVGVIMAVLSFAFYDIAVTVFVTILGVSAFSYLGIAIGLQENGFILFLLGLAGGIFGFILASSSMLSIRLVFSMTAFLGVGLILAGVFLLVGQLSLERLHETGIISAVIDVVDQSFLWLFVWIAGSIVALNAQVKIAEQEFMSNALAYEDLKTNSRRN